MIDLTGYVPAGTLAVIGRLRPRLGDDWTLIGGMMVAVQHGAWDGFDDADQGRAALEILTQR